MAVNAAAQWVTIPADGPRLWLGDKCPDVRVHFSRLFVHHPVAPVRNALDGQARHKLSESIQVLDQQRCVCLALNYQCGNADGESRGIDGEIAAGGRPIRRRRSDAVGAVVI